MALTPEALSLTSSTPAVPKSPPSVAIVLLLPLASAAAQAAGLSHQALPLILVSDISPALSFNGCGPSQVL